jgi:hypothetical protein
MNAFTKKALHRKIRGIYRPVTPRIVVDVKFPPAKAS